MQELRIVRNSERIGLRMTQDVTAEGLERPSEAHKDSLAGLRVILEALRLRIFLLGRLDLELYRLRRLEHALAHFAYGPFVGRIVVPLLHARIALGQNPRFCDAGNILTAHRV